MAQLPSQGRRLAIRSSPSAALCASFASLDLQHSTRMIYFLIGRVNGRTTLLCIGYYRFDFGPSVASRPCILYPFGSILAVRRSDDLRLRHVVRIRYGFPDFFFFSHVRQIFLGCSQRLMPKLQHQRREPHAV
jgi:hypothetical protein